jgi:glycosyltransferase involved in cell wall biosynthesis
MMDTVPHRAMPSVERRRLMLVTTCLSLNGGAEVQAFEMGRGLVQRGWDVEIVSLLPFSFPIPDLTGTGIRASSLEMRRGVAEPAALRRFIAMVRESRPDVVHSHMTHANLLTRAARVFCKMPVLICTLHGYKMYSVRSGSYGMRELAHRLTDGLADATTVVCEAAADRYAKIKAVSKKKLLMIPNGIRTECYQPNSSLRIQQRRDLNLRGEFVWLAVGRLEKVKDYTTMLQAFAVALETNVSQVLLIAGGGSLRSELEGLAADLGVTAHVRFLGVRSDVPKLMAAADAFVLSSTMEGLPLVLLEAGASGLPLVTTRVGGTAEAVWDGKGGLLAPAQNPRQLGEAMQNIAGMSDLDRLAMGRAAREFVVSRFGMDPILDRWEALYLSFMKRGAAQASKVKA